MRGSEELGLGGGEEGALAVVPVDEDGHCDGESEADCSNRQDDAEDGRSAERHDELVSRGILYWCWVSDVCFTVPYIANVDSDDSEKGILSCWCK